MGRQTGFGIDGITDKEATGVVRTAQQNGNFWYTGKSAIRNKATVDIKNQWEQLGTACKAWGGCGRTLWPMVNGQAEQGYWQR